MTLRGNWNHNLITVSSSSSCCCCLKIWVTLSGVFRHYFVLDTSCCGFQLVILSSSCSGKEFATSIQVCVGHPHYIQNYCINMSASSEWVGKPRTLCTDTDKRESSETNSACVEDVMILVEETACIFRIAHPLLTRKPEAYTPQVISIGPYHHKESLHYNETDSIKEKMKLRMQSANTDFNFAKLVAQIKKMDTEIRACYDRDITFNDDKLSSMLALDASFLLQFLQSSYGFYSVTEEGSSQLKERDPILYSKRKTPLWYAIQSDILMLENQVPLSLLGKVWKMTAQHGNLKPGISQHVSERDLGAILHAACSYFNPFSCGKSNPKPDITKIRHILEYLHHCIICQHHKNTVNPQKKSSVVKEICRLCGCCVQKKPEPGRHLGGLHNIIRLMFKKISFTTKGGSLPSAIELHGAGVKFKPCSSRDMREIHFNRSRSTLFLPEITINDSTEVVLRNLVAFELYLDTEEKPITRYTYLMDRLIDTQHDVAVLKRCGIINSQMGSDREVALMWNSMSKSLWENSFKPVDDAIEKTSKYYRTKWRVLLAECIEAHCSKPWVVLSIISALMLLVLTFIPVFCAFYPCNRI